MERIALVGAGDEFHLEHVVGLESWGGIGFAAELVELKAERWVENHVRISARAGARIGICIGQWCCSR
mgnify:CR=1 FL=1